MAGAEDTGCGAQLGERRPLWCRIVGVVFATLGYELLERKTGLPPPLKSSSISSGMLGPRAAPNARLEFGSAHYCIRAWIIKEQPNSISLVP